MFGSGARRSHLPTVRSVLALGSVALLVAAALAPTSFAAAPFPIAGTAVVDGDPSEWGAGDHFADMTDNGEADGEVLATLSLRYDCETETLFALVLATGEGQLRQDRPDEAYLRIDGSGKLVDGNSGNDGTPPDFAWVGGDGTSADGYEASASIAPGAYTIRAHVLLWWDDSDGYLTLDSVPREAPLTIDCPEPTPEPTATPTATPEATATATPEPTATATPEPTPTGSVEPTASASATPTTPAEPTPTGSVDAATGTPAITLPPTDTGMVGGPTSPADGMRLAFLGLGLLMGALALLVPAPRRREAVKESRSK